MPLAREPGKATAIAKTATGVGAVGLTTAGTIMAAVAGGTAVGGPVGAILGALGAGLGIAAGLIDPGRAAVKQALVQSGFSKGFATEYAKAQRLDDAGLQSRMAKLGQQHARQPSIETLDKMNAVLVVHRERRAAELAALPVAGPPVAKLPGWAPTALLATVIIGAAVWWTGRRR